MIFNRLIRAANIPVVVALLVLFLGTQQPAHALAPMAFAALPKQRQASLDELEKRTFEYFRDSANTANGLVPDHWPQQPAGDYFSSIAAVGFGLTAYGIGVERGWMKRSEAVKRTLATLKFFHDAPQGDAANRRKTNSTACR